MSIAGHNSEVKTITFSASLHQSRNNRYGSEFAMGFFSL